MPMASGNLVAQSPVMMPMAMAVPAPLAVMPEALAKDAMLAWLRTEFAAANAIIDVLTGHLSTVYGRGGDYELALHEIHRRRASWFTVIHLQRYQGVGDILAEFRRLTAAKLGLLRPLEVESQSEKKPQEIEPPSEEKPLEIEPPSEEKPLEIEPQGEKNDAVDACLDHQKNDAVDACLDHQKNDAVDACLDHRKNDAVDSCLDDEKEKGSEEYESPNSVVTELGSQDVPTVEHVVEICDNHEDCEARLGQIKLTKGFNAKESVKNHMVNVVKGLKLYEEVFTEDEICKLRDCVNEMRTAGQNGELLGDTFILFNQQMKGNRRELIQLGVPIFGQVKDDSTNNNQTSNIEPMPNLLENVIDHLLQWKLIPEYKRPNGCIITFFEEGEYSQPFLKPPHLDQPISTLLLSDSAMAFGRILSSDNDGNYKGALMLSLKEGSLLVMRGNSSDMARHVMCPSSNQRISITFFRVRPESAQCQSPTSPLSVGPNAMTVWQPSPYAAPNGASYDASSMEMMSKWGGALRSPVIMLTPVRPIVVSPRRAPSPPGGNGTGVFLPWAMGSRKPHKHLPPRAQKGRLLALSSPAKARVEEINPEAGINAIAKSA